MKKLICLLTVFLLCAVCISGASAFTYDNPAVVNPSGSLSPGETVTASMVITLPPGSATTSTSLSFNTDLSDAVWNIDIYRNILSSGEAPLTQKIGYGTRFSIDGWSLSYDAKTTLVLNVLVTGKVSTYSSGESIKVMSIIQSPAPSAEKSTYSTPAQNVYNPDNFDSDVAEIEKRISAIEARIPTYSNYDIDMSQAQSYVGAAKTNIDAAKSSGKSDIKNAYVNIEAADKQLVNAEMYISGSALNFIKANTDLIKSDIATLEEKGWKSEAALLAASNQQIINLYTLAKATYDAGSVPDVDTNLADSFTTLAKANKYVEDASQNPFAAILNYWWIILIVVGAAAVVAGIIFFIKRRGGSWDELG